MLRDLEIAEASNLRDCRVIQESEMRAMKVRLIFKLYLSSRCTYVFVMCSVAALGTRSALRGAGSSTPADRKSVV